MAFYVLLASLLLPACSQIAGLPSGPLTVTQTPTPSPTSILSFPLPTPETFFDGLRVTFVSNEGFLITCGDKKILIDAVFSAGIPPGLPDLMVNSSPPFDNIDLILVTHEHADHFDPVMMRKVLQTHPAAVLVSTTQVAELLKEYQLRVIALQAVEGQPDATEVEGIRVEAFRLTHGRYSGGAINFGYLITVNNVKLFHAGDLDSMEIDLAYLKRYDFDGERIDIAFLPQWMLTNLLDVPLVEQGVGSRYIIPIHYEFVELPLLKGLTKQYYPDAIFYEHNLQSWVLPAEVK